MAEEVKRIHCAGLKPTAAAVLLSVSTLLFAATGTIRITDVSFPGAERLGKAQLLLTVGLRIGDTYTERQLRVRLEEGIERLYRTGEFEEVGPLSACRFEDFAGGTRVIIPVKEKRRINVVYFRGAKPVGKSYLSKDLKTAAGRLLSRAALQEDRETVLRRCRARGFLFAEVGLQVDELPGGKANVTFNVWPGPRTRIESITFTGTKRVSPDDLLGRMATRERDRWLLGLWRKGYFSPRRFAEDMRKLRAYLRGACGLLDATVGLQDMRFDERRERLFITIHVEEGEPYYLKGFDLRVYTAGGRTPRFSAEKILQQVRAQELVGGVYRGVELDQLADRIRMLYLDAGYLNCRVRVLEPRIELAGNKVTAVLEVEEGKPVYARRIDIRGNTETKDEVIRRELAFMPGELVTREKMQKSLSNLYRLQYFVPETLDIRPLEATSGEEGTDFLVEVEEGPRGQLLFGVGLASDFGVVGNFILRKNNFDISDLPKSFWDIPSSFSGGGQTLGLELQPGTRYSRYRVYFQEPYLFGHWYGLTLSASRHISGRDAWLEKEWNFAFRIHRYLNRTRDVTLSAGFRHNIMELTDLDSDAPTAAFESRGTTRLTALSAGFSVDKGFFDPYAGPYKGYRLYVDYEYAGGFLDADVDFSKARSGAAAFLPLYENAETGHHVLTLTANVGWMEPHSDSRSIPIYERFWLGGPYNVRGFRTFGVGPHENGIEVGGTALLYGTVEYSWPLLLVVPEARLLRGVAFFDWGQLEPRFEKLSTGRMRLSAGFGIRISLTPLGMPVPISLYWGEVIRDRPEDRRRSFTFSIGHIAY